MRIARKAGEQAINFRIAYDGRSAQIERLSGGNGRYTLTPLGEIEAGDALDCYFQIALNYLPLDAELFSLLAQIVQRRADQIDTAFHEAMKRLDSLAATVSDSLVTLRRRHVRA